ncbi:hypothetical protein F7R01_13945 [Pseudomonas argentinensis]|uniref:Lipoprotein n=1 Tax=Phytopseudomonas argentinensis TaxID=289370 RepID=A0A1I3HAC0_9GAMM|nr:DUF6279 family lipoprotein [Pseudomonas argentinensis]KAB0548552.1 hypothetical protein F7R01_13945 [Pseudomonas argentinensis]SFI32613.1 hypothetical protein SAMN05216602_0734 [Pseudomonas argentinensis]
MSGYLKSLLLLLSLGLLVSACSKAGLAYRNLDWVIAWRVDQYLDLDSQQKAWFKPRLQEHLAWHCSTELPRYVDWLQRTRDLLQEPAPDAGQLEAKMIEAEQAFHAVVQQTNPTAVALLADLRPKQVERLYARMEKDNVEDRQKFLEPPLQTQISERAERLEKRLKPWFGTLNEAQQARIARWASERRDQNRLWLENRARWQSEFRSVLDQRDAEDFAQRMSHVLENRRGAHDQQATQAYEQSRQAMAALLSDLLAAADDQQRTQVNQRIASLQSDLAGQICAG